MRVAGIICEYNPFHNGHKKQFDLTRAALGPDTAIVCAMSGNFVQRGEPALFPRTLRARAAVDCGADLVLELPLTACLSSAEGFAAGGAALLDALGIVTHLSFGCETADGAALWQAAECLCGPDFPAALRPLLDAGIPFAAARQQALDGLTGLGGLLDGPNNILAVEYCKALLRLSSRIQPLPLARAGSYTHSLDPENPAAAQVRQLLAAGSADWQALLPPQAAELFAHAPQYRAEYGQRAMLAVLRQLSEDRWAAAPHGGEGLYHRVRTAVCTQPDLAGVLSAAASGRYPTARVRRLMLCAFLGVSDLSAPLTHARVLAFNARGRELLHQAKKAGTLPLIHAGEPAPDGSLWALEQQAADLYALFGDDLSRCPPGSARQDRVYYQKQEETP